MRLNELYPFPEERKGRKRLGRGSGSGLGKTAGKGHKGQKSRSGGKIPRGFEGGQMPLQRRLPKRGFTNAQFTVEYAPLNLGRLVKTFEGQAAVTLDDIYARGLCPKGMPVKILAHGDVASAMTIEAHRFSKAAAEKITAAGGTAKSLEA